MRSLPNTCGQLHFSLFTELPSIERVVDHLDRIRMTPNQRNTMAVQALEVNSDVILRHGVNRGATELRYHDVNPLL